MAYTPKEYKESDAVKSWREQMESHAGLKPADYVSQYQPQINSTLDSILNRKDFQYDVNGDALYQQYKDRYVNLGQQAMMDTMGQAAKLTGGYGNSNAQMVGQQAYQGYLQGLTDKIPELAQMAQQRYAQQGQDLYQKYGLLNTHEQNAYQNWQNMYNQWLTERDYLSGRYDTERGYDYGTYRDSVADEQWKAQFDEDLRRFELQWAATHPTATVGGGGGYGGGDGYVGGNPNPGSDGGGTTSAIMYAGQKAATEGLAAATQWINENSGNMSNAEKVAAQANANGAARTEAIKKALGR